MLTREQERAAVQSMILRLAMICNQRGGGFKPLRQIQKLGFDEDGGH
jgi:hypothetical protein